MRAFLPFAALLAAGLASCGKTTSPGSVATISIGLGPRGGLRVTLMKGDEVRSGSAPAGERTEVDLGLNNDVARLTGAVEGKDREFKATLEFESQLAVKLEFVGLDGMDIRVDGQRVDPGSEVPAGKHTLLFDARVKLREEAAPAP